MSLLVVYTNESESQFVSNHGRLSTAEHNYLVEVIHGIDLYNSQYYFDKKVVVMVI